MEYTKSSDDARESGDAVVAEREAVAWHAMSAEEALEGVESAAAGLSAETAAERLEQHGPNSLSAERGPGLFSVAVGQLKNPLILMLLAAAAVSVLAGHPVDALVILAVIVMNSVIGIVQESRAERALEALRELSAPHARVVRDGSVREVAAAEVVPGDVVAIETGDRIPADLRITEAVELRIDESALTGESEPVEKNTAPVEVATPLADRTGMAWTSTSVTGGRGRGVVVATGMETVIGKIAAEVQGTSREDTPLQRRLAKLSVILGVGAVLAATAIFVFGLLRGFDVLEMLLFAVAAAVSAIPEGLPAVVSVVLAVGVQRMSHRKAILRRLPAVETLGSTTVICSDKTGTITRNQMTVSSMWTTDGFYDVERDAIRATGPDPEGDGREVPIGEAPRLRALATIGVVSNNSLLVDDGPSVSVIGNPTDGALLVAGRIAGLDITPEGPLRQTLDDIPLSSATKYAAALGDGEGGKRLYVKGAPERVLGFCSRVLTAQGAIPLDGDSRRRIEEANEAMAARALRVVAGAYKDMPAAIGSAERSEAESDLIFVGMWGMLDPPRDEAIDAIASAQGAGVRVVMITGDHAVTASAIAERVGLLAGEGSTVTGQELDSLSDDDLLDRVDDIAVYARVAPEHKYRIVEALKRRGEVVAMTGDGVNDAPALKAADIGIAMGVTGTEVAKEAADMVLGDDNFATIVYAVEEGRVIYSNLRRVVAFLISTTTAEVLTLFAALFLGFHLPLTAVMILWINLVADGISTVPLGLEPKHADVLDQPPRPRAEGILTRLIVSRLLVLATLAATATMILFAQANAEGDLAYAQTVAFTTLAAFEWFKALTWRTSNQSVFKVGLFSNRWLVIALATGIVLQILAVQSPLGHVVFGTRPLSLAEWGLIIATASSVLVFDEIGKLLLGRRQD